MKDLKRYLSSFESSNLTIIGPMYNGEVETQEPLVFVDGGSINYKGIGFIVGDGDSSSIVMHEKLAPEKNFSDLAYVLSSIPKEVKIIKALGFLGGRKDHELINFGEFFNFLDKFESMIILSESLTLYSPQTLSLNFNGVFSVINSRPGKLIISGNCEYVFNNLAKIPYSSQFLSNRAQGKFQVVAEMPFGIFTVYK